MGAKKKIKKRASLAKNVKTAKKEQNWTKVVRGHLL